MARLINQLQMHIKRFFRDPGSRAPGSPWSEPDGMAITRGATRRWLVRFPRGLPIAIFAFISAITVMSVLAIERGEDDRAAAQLRSRTTAIASALERRANASSAYLRAGAALLATLDEVSAVRFRRFVSELRLDADYRGADGIGWAQVVRPGEVELFDAAMEQEAPDRVRMYPPPGGGQPYSVPVTFLQPDTLRNRSTLGFDMFSEPVRRAAMIEAERTSQPSASGAVAMRQEGGEDAPGFLIYMPVYRPAPGGRELRGYIFSPFNAQDFLASALELEDAGAFGIRLYDGDTPDANLLAEMAGGREGGDISSERVTIANSPWLLQVESWQGGGLSGLSIATLVFGLLVAGLLMALLRLLTRQALEDEATLRWFEEQESIRNSLTRELNHRVKNTLANVLSIIALTRRRAANVNEFADGLDGRIRALSATHDLLTRSDWGATPLRSVVEAELRPYAHAGDHEVDIAGPEIELAPNDALSLGLAMHELATNAAKYGSLSQAGGRVTVRWELSTESLVRLEWAESGGPAVPQERGRGFGMDLIQRVVANELDNPVRLSFDPQGVHCVLTIPVRKPSEFSMRVGRLTTRTVQRGSGA